MPPAIPECVFESSTPAACDAPRLLLITYHFPPGQAAGALRWEKFAIHGAARGWAFDVIALDPASLASADPSRLENLPPGTRIFGVDDPDPVAQRLKQSAWRIYRSLRSPYRKTRVAIANPPALTSQHNPSFHRHEVAFHPLALRSWLRTYNVWLEYTRAGAWARRTAALGQRLVEPGAHRALVSSGPPHMAHIGARELSRATGLPFVIDLRDPWSLFERLTGDLASPLWYRYARRHEPNAVREAALVVMNTEPARRAMLARYPEQADRIITVNNGYDAEQPLPKATRDGRFLVAYAGSVYLDRNPGRLFEAAGRVVRELELSPADFGIELMGHHVTGADEKPIRAMAERAEIGAFLGLHPPGTQQQAAAFLARATMLVNLPQDSHLAIPSKIFEYMRYDSWLLALAERESATELLLRETDADVVSPDDVESIAEVLRKRYADHVAGRRPEPIARDTRFSRRTQAEHLFEAIEKIVGKPSEPATETDHGGSNP
jgi:glycosyltransferase involved in cell wall biosynthesis